MSAEDYVLKKNNKKEKYGPLLGKMIAQSGLSKKKFYSHLRWSIFQPTQKNPLTNPPTPDTPFLSWQNPRPGLVAGMSKGVQAPISFTHGAFFVPVWSFWRAVRGSLWLAGFLWAGLLTTCSPLFFMCKGGSLNSYYWRCDYECGRLCVEKE